MPEVDHSYRLVIFLRPDDPQAVRDLICRVTGRHPTDVMQWVARAPGIWPHPLAEGEVRAILDGLYDLEVPAEAHRLDRIPMLAPARSARDVACTAEGLRVRGLRGEPIHWVPWDRLELVCGGLVDQPDELRTIAPPTWVSAVRTGLNALLRRPSVVARRERSMRIERGPVAEAILVRREPLLALRVASDTMNYAYLGARKGPHAGENFRLFLLDLVARAEWAYISESTRELLRPPADAPGERPETFASSQALLDFATVQLLWSRYRRDRESDCDTAPG